jgi:hypothetical protein
MHRVYPARSRHTKKHKAQTKSAPGFPGRCSWEVRWMSGGDLSLCAGDVGLAVRPPAFFLDGESKVGCMRVPLNLYTPSFALVLHLKRRVARCLLGVADPDDLSGRTSRSLGTAVADLIRRYSRLDDETAPVLAGTWFGPGREGPENGVCRTRRALNEALLRRGFAALFPGGCRSEPAVARYLAGRRGATRFDV